MITTLDLRAAAEADARQRRQDRRERIATAALQGILTNPAAGVCWPMQEIARYAVSYADALIAELDKEPQS